MPVEVRPNDRHAKFSRASASATAAATWSCAEGTLLDAYLRGVAHAEVDDFDPPRYLTSRGGAPRRAPSAEPFWDASVQGPGRQTVSWEVESGRWSVVAMNADGARRVVLHADVAAKVGWFLGVGIALLAAGLLLLAGGIVLIVVVFRRSSRPANRPG